MWDLIVSVPDHCLSFYYDNQASKRPDGSDRENLTNKRDRQYSRSPGDDPGRSRSDSFDRNADLNLKGLDIPAAKV